MDFTRSRTKATEALMSKEALTRFSRDSIVQGRYRIRGLLGKGGMGAVYEAVDERLSRNIAIKVTSVESDELRHAFNQEAKLLANLQHLALPRVMDYFSEADNQFLVMEFVSGEDLAQLLRQRGHPFPCHDVLRWADDLLDALTYLHGHQPPVIHRDIKPSNLKQKTDGHIMLLDFGLAKGAPGLLSRSNNTLSVLGYSPHYAPLEQIRGEKTTPQSDLYSLAATLYELLTNRRPDDALQRAATVIDGQTDPLVDIREINPQVPHQFASNLMRALSLQPARRPASAAAMRTALTSLGSISSLPDQYSPASLTISNEEDEEVTRTQSPFWGGNPQRVEPLVHSAQAGLWGASLEHRSPFDVDIDFQLPDIGVLNAPPNNLGQSDEELLDRATILSEMFAALKVRGQIAYINPGSVLTTYEFSPAHGVKYSSIAGLNDDICLALQAPWANIERIPGTSNIGIQIPNPRRRIIYLREIIESKQFRASTSKLTVALGEATSGVPYVADLSQLAHLLVAGTNGAGKSILINTLIVSILYKARPDEVKFIMIDPRRVELGIYADIPHLATPIIIDSKRAAMALNWAVAEMERRLKRIAECGVRSITDFNSVMPEQNSAMDPSSDKTTWKPLPRIVIVIDELADLMKADDGIQESLVKLARQECAVGIHLVLATQRPSVDVITGAVKASFPTRIAFRVSSETDSRIIIDTKGAEDLLGLGDMLFSRPKEPPVRLHGAFVDDSEIGRVVYWLKVQARPTYDETIMQP